MPSRIEDYALVGDCETAALVSQNGCISLRQNTTGAPAKKIKAPVALSAIRETLAEGVVQAFRVNSGGDVTVMSEPGKGSVFTVRLPSGEPA
jgi:hypothetical protein